MTTELAAWLTQILDEEEQRENGRWRTRLDMSVAEVTTHPGGMTVRRDHGGREEHISREAYFAEFCERAPDPEVLARITAHRKIIKLHARQHECPLDGEYSTELWRAGEACSTQLLLASQYASRPGYREEWR